MRDIKFDLLVKNKNTGYFHHKKYYLSELMLGIDKLFDIENYETVANRQYIGFKDVKGIEIYEDDILKHHGIVTWNDVEYCWSRIDLTWNDKREWHALDSLTSPFEIIGNIHENPDLLKAGS